MRLVGAVPTALPWWMTTAIVLGWLAVIAAIVLIARHRRSLARSRRPETVPPLDRELPHRTGPPLELGPGDQT